MVVSMEDVGFAALMQTALTLSLRGLKIDADKAKVIGPQHDKTNKMNFLMWCMALQDYFTHF